jgi:hypothetical protein
MYKSLHLLCAIAHSLCDQKDPIVDVVNVTKQTSRPVHPSRNFFKARQAEKPQSHPNFCEHSL